MSKIFHETELNLNGSETRKKSGERITPGALKHLVASADVNHDACIHALHTYNKMEKKDRERERERERENGKRKRKTVKRQCVRDNERARERVDRESEGSWLLMTRR